MYRRHPLKALVVFCALLSIAILVSTPGLSNAADGWIPVAEGVDYKEIRLPDPNRVFIARMDRSNPRVTIDSMLAKGELGAGSQVINKMAQVYDQALNNWGDASWGSRNHVAVAINGSYVDKYGFPQSGQIQSSWYIKRFDDISGGSGFAWTKDRDAFVGGCVQNKTDKQYIQNLATKVQLQIAGVNVVRDIDGLFLYTPQWGANTGTLNVGVEVLVEVSRPTMVYPGPRLSIQGVVRAIRDMQGSSPIPFDSIVLSARGTARNQLLALVKVGDQIGINQEITNLESNCQTEQEGDIGWTTAYASVSGDFVFLKNGQINGYDNNAGATKRAPRTAIAFNNAYIYFMVVDGRQPGVSLGMTISELGHFALETLEATEAIAVDGGGSSTMVVNGRVMNNPSDPCYRLYAPVVGVNAGQTRLPTPPPDPLAPATSSSACQRPVVNGMAMIVVEPMIQSITFKAGDEVLATQPTSLRLGPGTNYAEIAAVPSGTTGTILAHSNHLEGVLAKGTYWWKVSIGGKEGWIAEDSISRPIRFLTPKDPSN
jgi:hypothetical protein